MSVLSPTRYGDSWPSRPMPEHRREHVFKRIRYYKNNEPCPTLCVNHISHRIPSRPISVPPPSPPSFPLNSLRAFRAAASTSPVTAPDWDATASTASWAARTADQASRCLGGIFTGNMLRKENVCGEEERMIFVIMKLEDYWELQLIILTRVRSLLYPCSDPPQSTRTMSVAVSVRSVPLPWGKAAFSVM